MTSSTRAQVQKLIEELCFELIFGLTSIVAALAAVQYFLLMIGSLCVGGVALCVGLYHALRLRNLLS